MKKQESFCYGQMQIVITLMLIATFVTNCSNVYIIVHGTWGRESEWYLPQGDFFDALETSAHKLKAKVVSFTWSGGNNDRCRTRAAQVLAKLILSYPADTHIHLVTHSHGSNVGILASQLLALHDSSKYHIEQFYALGTPVDADRYIPDMRAIHWFYHFFSLGDFVQPVFGLFDRCYPAHERLANIRMLIEEKHPGHKELHAPMVARWLPAIHRLFAQQKINGFDFFNFALPGLIIFRGEKLPIYQIDKDREVLLKRDRSNIIAVRNALQYENMKILHRKTSQE